MDHPEAASTTRNVSNAPIAETVPVTTTVTKRTSPRKLSRSQEPPTTKTSKPTKPAKGTKPKPTKATKAAEATKVAKPTKRKAPTNKDKTVRKQKKARSDAAVATASMTSIPTPKTQPSSFSLPLTQDSCDFIMIDRIRALDILREHSDVFDSSNSDDSDDDSVKAVPNVVLDMNSIIQEEIMSPPKTSNEDDESTDKSDDSCLTDISDDEVCEELLQDVLQEHFNNDQDDDDDDEGNLEVEEEDLKFNRSEWKFNNVTEPVKVNPPPMFGDCMSCLTKIALAQDIQTPTECLDLMGGFGLKEVRRLTFSANQYYLMVSKLCTYFHSYICCY